MARLPLQVTAEPARLSDAGRAAQLSAIALREAALAYRSALARLADAEPVTGSLPDRSWQVEDAAGHLEALARGLGQAAAAVEAVDARSRSPAERAVLAADLGLEAGDAAATVVTARAAGHDVGWGARQATPTDRRLASPALSGRVAEGITRISGPAGIGLAGAGQLASDLQDPSLSEGQRVARVGAATVADGGIGAAGAAGGAKLGAAAGTLFAPGAGTIAGVIIGGVLGGVVGAATGGRLRSAAGPAVAQAGRGVDRALGGWRTVRSQRVVDGRPSCRGG